MAYLLQGSDCSQLMNGLKVTRCNMKILHKCDQMHHEGFVRVKHYQVFVRWQQWSACCKEVAILNEPLG